MRFQLATDLEGLAAYFPNFLALADQDRWKKRALQLARDAQSSPFQAKIVVDYHWLEWELTEQFLIQEIHGQLLPEQVMPRALGAMYFAGNLVEVYNRLSAAGRVALQGRVRDALKAETGFAALYLEMEIASLLLTEGFDIEFPDLEGTGRYDLHFTKGMIEGEVECKSLSADAGRKIHRKDFYRFIDALGPKIADRAANGASEVLLVTVEDRFPAVMERQDALRDALSRMLSAGHIDHEAGDFFTINREDYRKHLGPTPLSSEKELYRSCQDAFGDNCHASGAMTEKGSCLVVVRSRREDDTSKPLLEALKKAASQLSGSRPSFIAVQFDEIQPADLTLPHLRRRAGLFSYVLFEERRVPHLAAIYFCAYGGTQITSQGVGTPAFVYWNPEFHMEADGLPFRAGPSDSEFARLLGVDSSE